MLFSEQINISLYIISKIKSFQFNLTDFIKYDTIKIRVG